MDTRNGSSSPDPLGYPGNPEYLLSSATKPFARRLSISPQKSQTPRRGRPPGKRSPQKSEKKSEKKIAPPIRYEDIILPSTPSGTTRFDRRSLSPTKATLQSDGNISPWRIRVTVEAERDEDEENGNNVQEGNGAWTDSKTTKVPLKGGMSSAEPTPKRRRKQKTKSAISERVPTPKRKKGSVTPGKPLGSVETKRQSKTVKKLQFSEDTTPMRKEFSPLPAGDPIQSENDPFLDLSLDNNTDGANSVGEQSAAAFDEMMDFDVPNPESRDVDDVQLEYPILPGSSSKDVPLDQRRESTPAASSPIQRQTGISPRNAIDAGHTPMPKSRIYPTPTSSSLLDEDGLEKTPRFTAESQTKQVKLNSPRTTDPTDQHREFDSIMESEGFSMVSLDTLPSRQRNNLFQNQSGQTGLPAGVTGQNTLDNLNFGSSISKHPMTVHARANQSERSRSHLHQVTLASEESSHRNDIPYTQTQTQTQQTPFIRTLSSPHQPSPVPAPALQQTRDFKRRPWARLARVVRAGIALQGVLSRRHTNTHLQSSFDSPHASHVDDLEATKKRLDDLFQGFNAETQRELRAGLRFGEELAKRVRQTSEKQHEDTYDDTRQQNVSSPAQSKDVAYPEIESLTKNVELSSSSPMVLPQRPTITEIKSPLLYNNAAGSSEISMDSMMARREAEWQREREEISRRIAEANSSQVIVIDSDENVARPSDNDQEIMTEPEPVSIVDQEEDEDEEGGEEGEGDEEEEVVVEEEGEEEEEEENHENGLAEETEDDGYEDIWQQEARGAESQPQSPSFTDIIHEELPKPRRTKILSPWRTVENVDYIMDDEEMLPLPEWSSRQNGFPLIASGKTKMAKYRDADASLSSIVGTPETVTRNFYEGNFIPANGTSQLDKSPEILSPSNPSTGMQHPEATQPRSASSPLSFSEPRSASFNQSSEEQSTRSNEESLDIQPEVSFTPRAVSREANREEYTPSLTSNEVDTPDHSVVESVMGTEEYMDEDVDNVSSPSGIGLQEPTATATWFNKLTSNLAPAWLTSTPAVTKRRKDDEQYTHRQAKPNEHPPQQRLPIQQIPKPSLPPNTAPKPKALSSKKPPQRRPSPLALSGYFTDDHYVALRRIYREAKERPDKFIYQSTPERDVLLGRWMWSADGIHRRQITEIQLAIVDRFINDLIYENKRHGGSGKMEWSELEILWRLFSIIVGEQLRRERKREAAMMNNERHHAV